MSIGAVIAVFIALTVIVPLLVWRRFRRLRLVLIVGVPLAMLYLGMPVVASAWEIGDRRGPRIYPERMHSIIFCLAWELSPHDAKKPRVPYTATDASRPWFYGLPSEADPPRDQ